MGRRDVNMLSGSIVKGLMTISIPIMVMNVIQSLFSIIDMTILKSYDAGGGIAVGAVGVCSTLITTITGLVIGISSGANVVIARHIGRRDALHVSRAVGTSMAFSVVSGLVLTLIGLTFANPLLVMVNCPDSLRDQAAIYFRLYFAGVPLLMIYNFSVSVLRSVGNSRQPMIFFTTGGAIKVAFSYLLIAVYDMGVVGVALATIISWFAMAAMSVFTLFRTDSIVKLRLKNLRFYKQELLDILRIGVPAGLQKGLYSVANVIISATVNTFGDLATTGISIANQFDNILYQISCATSFAVMPYVSQNVGSRNIKRAMESVWKGILITVALGASFGSLSAIFSRELSSIMSSDPTVINFSQQKMIIISSTYFICGINEIFGAALRGMGKPVAATTATLVFMCLLRFVWVYLIFPLCPNLTFLYLVWPVGWTLSIISLLFVFIPTARKLAKSVGQPLQAAK